MKSLVTSLLNYHSHSSNVHIHDRNLHNFEKIDSSKFQYDKLTNIVIEYL